MVAAIFVSGLIGIIVGLVIGGAVGVIVGYEWSSEAWVKLTTQKKTMRG